MFQDLVGGRKKSISRVKYFKNLKGALGLASNTPPENNCTKRSCREVSIALDGYWALPQGYVQIKEQHYFCIYQWQKTGDILIFLSTTYLMGKLKELRRPMGGKKK